MRSLDEIQEDLTRVEERAQALEAELLLAEQVLSVPNGTYITFQHKPGQRKPAVGLTGVVGDSRKGAESAEYYVYVANPDGFGTYGVVVPASAIQRIELAAHKHTAVATTE